MEMALALGRAPLAVGQELRQAAIGRAVGREGEHARRIGEIEPRAGKEAQPRLFGGNMRAHHASQRVAVGEGERREPQLLRPQHQLFGVRRAPQEAEIARRRQLGKVVSH